MNEREKALRRLLDAIEQDGFGICPLSLASFGRDTFSDPGDIVSLAFNGSLDAAKVLHESVLQGWEWRLRENRAWVWQATISFGGDETEDEESNGLPARAWLIAILLALIAKEGEA